MADQSLSLMIMVPLDHCNDEKRQTDRQRERERGFDDLKWKIQPRAKAYDACNLINTLDEAIFIKLIRKYMSGPRRTKRENVKVREGRRSEKKGMEKKGVHAVEKSSRMKYIQNRENQIRVGSFAAVVSWINCSINKRIDTTLFSGWS